MSRPPGHDLTALAFGIAVAVSAGVVVVAILARTLEDSGGRWRRLQAGSWIAVGLCGLLLAPSCGSPTDTSSKSEGRVETPATLPGGRAPGVEIPPPPHVLTASDPSSGEVRWAVARDDQIAGVCGLKRVDDVVVGIANTGAGAAGGWVVAWNRATGRELWRIPNEAAATSPPRLDLGVSRDAEDVIALPSDDRVAGVDLGDGTTRWTTSLDGAEVVQVGATDSAIIVSTTDGNGASAVAGLNPTTGVRKWTTVRDVGAYGTPTFVAGEDLVVLPGAKDGTLAGIDATDGSVRWQIAASAGSDRANPAIGDGDVLVASAGETRESTELMAFDPSNGMERWRRSGINLPQIVEIVGPIYATSAEGVSALDPATGDDLWLKSWEGQDAVYGAGFHGPSLDGDALFLRTGTGEKIWAGGAELVGVGGAPIWETTTAPGEDVSEVAADRDSFYWMHGCSGGN